MGKGGSESEGRRCCNAGRCAGETAPLLELPYRAAQRVLGMQAKLHRWAAADPGRRFDDCSTSWTTRRFSLMACDRVAGEQGRPHGGGRRPHRAAIEASASGVPGFLDGSAGTAEGPVRSGRCRCGNARSPKPSRARSEARDPHGRRPGRPGGAEAGAGTDLRGRLRAGSVTGSGPGGAPTTRSRRSATTAPRLSVGARRRHRGVLRRDHHTALMDRVRDRSRTSGCWRW